MYSLTQRDYQRMKELREQGDDYGAYLVSVGQWPADGGMTGEGMLSTLNLLPGTLDAEAEYSASNGNERSDEWTEEEANYWWELRNPPMP